jgi:hypothetical protein
MISDINFKKIVEEFSKPRKEFNGESYITRRREWFDKPMENIRPLLLKDALDNLTLDNAKQIYNEMSVGGPKLYPRTYIENGLEKIKTSLKYLLYGNDELEERFYNFAGNPESDYRLNGVGRAFASTALFLINHKEYGIWNGAVDGGLKMLDIRPKRKRGEHIGETYFTIVKVLKELQKKCGFEDLSVTDEFVELIYHEKIGTDVLGETGKEIEKAAEQEEIIVPQKEAENIHLQNQYFLVRIGQMRGYDVWVAVNDRNKSYKGKALNSITIDELPHFAGPNVLRIAKSIDVIWFKKRTDQPVCFFEIEHTTSMYSGLLRLNDVKIDYPIPKAFIVGPKERRNLFESQIQRRSFVSSELSEICQFLTYDDVEKLRGSYETIKDILV